MAKTEEKPPELTVQANTVIGSTYAQIVSFTITDTEATFEFVYVNPQIKTQANTVARITVPLKSAEELGKIIPDTFKKHEENKKRT